MNMETTENKELEIYIIAYNNIFCVEYQIKAFKAFCLDQHKLIIVDSNCGHHPENSIEKKLICEKYGVEFTEIPQRLSGGNRNPSVILADKLKYVFDEIIRVRKPKYFALIDQDFFPFRKFTVKNQLDDFGMYGDVNEMDGNKTETHLPDDIVDGPWTIHPWLSFYKYDTIKNYDLDWSPVNGFDCGGGNWEALIKPGGFDKKNYWRRHKTIMYFPFDSISGCGPHPYEKHYFRWNDVDVYSQVQIYDGTFIHMLNSKYLDDPSNPKTNWCKGFLDMSLLLDGKTEFTNENGFHNEGPANKI
jgi:hypothetical protein